VPRPARGGGWGRQAHLLVGALSHSGRWRGRLCEAESFPHLVEGLDTVSRALVGLTRSPYVPGTEPRRTCRRRRVSGHVYVYVDVDETSAAATC